MARTPRMTLLVISLNIVFWPLIQLTLARLFLRLPDALFAADSWLTIERGFERDGQLYRRFLMMQRWKELLPDGASRLGGRAKNNVASRSVPDLTIFAIETRRAEIAHWCMLFCTPVFYIWNPLWACIVMTLYGMAANLPCIFVQRANRMKVARILHRSEIPERKANSACRMAIT
jgi:glycosyl-4,4'-diaponeurosporenoate acyltransferase